MDSRGDTRRHSGASPVMTRRTHAPSGVALGLALVPVATLLWVAVGGGDGVGTPFIVRPPIGSEQRAAA